MTKFGNACIRWTPPAAENDPNTERVFLLDQPLTEVTPRHNQTVYRRESLDRSAVASYAIADGAYELTGTIRYSADPDGLVDMLKAGRGGTTLTYVPNLNDPALYNAVWLMDPLDASPVLDAQRAGYGEHQVTVRFRKTDGSPFTGQVKGTEVIFSYRAGGSLKHGVATATFSRATSTSAPASYASISTGDLGFGSISTAATNAPRVSWMANPTSLGPRMFPTLLLEPARTNYVKRSENLGSTSWTLIVSLTRTSGQADPMGGTAAWLLNDASTGAGTGAIRGQASVTSSTFCVGAVFLKAGTSTASRVRAFSSAGVLPISLLIAWSSGVPTVTATVGVAGPTERWRDGFYRVQGRSTATVTSGAAWVFEVQPAQEAGKAGSITMFGAQLE